MMKEGLQTRCGASGRAKSVRGFFLGAAAVFSCLGCNYEGSEGSTGSNESGKHPSLTHESKPLAEGGSPEQPITASLIAIVAAPERFHQKWIRVAGFVALEFENKAVYVRKDDFDNVLLPNGLWLDVARDNTFLLSDPGYAVVEGQFDSEKHPEAFSGAIVEIRRITPLPPRER